MGAVGEKADMCVDDENVRNMEGGGRGARKEDEMRGVGERRVIER